MPLASVIARNWLRAAVLALLCLPTPARADRIENEVAVVAALDKVTARIERIELPIGQMKRFGSLKVTLRACYSRTPTEAPKTTAFLEVLEIKLDGTEKSLFSGWMFAESPGLNALEHPVFDMWLTDCAKPLNQRATPVVQPPVATDQKRATQTRQQPAAQKPPGPVPQQQQAPPRQQVPPTEQEPPIDPADPTRRRVRR